MNFFGFALAHLNQAVGNKASGNAIRNAVAQSHENTGKESGDGLGEIVPFDFLEGGSHHYTYQHQSGRRGGRRNGADKGGQKGTEGEAD